MRFFFLLFLFSVPQLVYGRIAIVELSSNPQQGSEWVKIQNDYDIEIPLTGWSLVEGAGKVVALEGSLASHEIRSFDVKGLNNSGDIVKLFDGCSVQVDEVVYGNYDDGNIENNYPAPKKGETLVIETVTETKIETSPPSMQMSTSEEEAKIEEDEDMETVVSVADFSKGDLISMSGIVSVKPDVIESRALYLQTPQQGIQVYFSSRIREPVHISRGDALHITGKLSEKAGEQKINVSSLEDVHIVAKNKSVLPVSLSIAQIEEVHIGSLIQVQGRVQKKSRSYFIEQDDASLTLVLPEAVKELPAHSQVEVVGILRPYKDTWRLYIRDAYDIQEYVSDMGKSGEMPILEELPILQGQASKGNRYYIIWFIGAFLIGGAYIYLKFRKKELILEQNERSPNFADLSRDLGM